MTRAAEQLFDPRVALQLGRLNLIARTAVEGFIAGLHRSSHRGFSAEFTDHRPYSPGDDLRHLDQFLLARTGRHYVKRYEQHANLRAHLAVDASASMGYASQTLSKLRYAACLAAMVAYLMVRQQDKVGLATFADRLGEYLSPGSTPRHLNHLFGVLGGLQPGGRTATRRALAQLAPRMPRRGLLVLFSDLLDEPEQVFGALGHFRQRKHQVIVFQVLDPGELELPFDRPVRLIDAETRQKLLIDPKRAAGAYRRRVRQVLGEIRRRCSDAGVEYVLARTDQPYDGLLAEYLTRRAASRRTLA